jgi:hypothetical protein
MGCRRAMAVLTSQSVNAYVPSHVHLVYGVLALGRSASGER